ncbi:MAG: metal ABC transporter permease [Rhodospirillaceae bacterium]|nr:metal ABC transporter permease [Rhodospirillaceae bacterium]
MDLSLDNFVVRAVIAGLGVAMVAGPLGCFVVWRRMAYFGDTLSHAGLMGVALGIMIGIDPTVGIIATGVMISLLLLALQHQHRLPSDTLLGILSHAALSVGLIVVSFMDQVRFDLMGYLFGDILAVTRTDLAWIYGGGAVLLGVLAAIWRPLIALTVHQDMAVAEGVARLSVRLTFMVLMALTVAVAMKIVGILLVTALLIIPPAAARRFAGSPESMAVITVVLGGIAVAGGVAASLTWDTPSGPSIVVTAALLFVLSLGAGLATRARA